jgi:hypothetical protein
MESAVSVERCIRQKGEGFLVARTPNRPKVVTEKRVLPVLGVPGR